MNSIADILTYALAAVFVQNVVFSSTSDVSLTLLALRKPPKLAAVSVLVSLFSLLSTLTIYPLDVLLDTEWLSYMPIRGVLLAASALMWYLVVSAIVRKIDGLNKKIGFFLAPAALNGAVMAVPLLLGTTEIGSIWAAVGMAAGSGAGFALASWLINIGMRRANNPDMPKCFQGAPAMLIYIGLLSLLFRVFGI